MNFNVKIALLMLGLSVPVTACAQAAGYYKWFNYTLVIDPDSPERVQINLPTASGYEEDAPITHGTRSPAIFMFQDWTVYPNGNTGWHYHPGSLLITVAEGTVDWFDMACNKHVRKPGEFFTEDSEPHFVRNSSAAPARLIITYVIAKGLTFKIYSPAPPCADKLGLK